MRIAFCGKGGSGKTTAASLFVESLLEQGRPVLAIDADINQTLGAALGLSIAEIEAIPAMGTDSAFLKDYVRGSNSRLPSSELVMKTTPPGPGSRTLRPGASDPVIAHYAACKGNLAFIRVGGFESADIGTHCFHAKTGAVELALNHLLDGAEDTVVVDMTAGADAFASGLFTRFDLTVLMVEPTRQSVSVFEQYCDYARDYAPNIVALGNKVSDGDDAAFLSQALGPALIGSLRLSNFVKQRDRGLSGPASGLEPDNNSALETLDRRLRAQPRDWQAYWNQTVKFHHLNAESWANAMTGQDLGLQVDRDYLDRLSA